MDITPLYNGLIQRRYTTCSSIRYYTNNTFTFSTDKYIPPHSLSYPVPVPCSRCPCIYHGTDEIHIAYHEGVIWCLKCGHRICLSSQLPVYWANANQSPIGTRNPYLLTFIRPHATDGGSPGDASPDTPKPRKDGGSRAIVDTQPDGAAPKEEMIGLGGNTHPCAGTIRQSSLPQDVLQTNNLPPDNPQTTNSPGEIRKRPTPENKDGNGGAPYGGPIVPPLFTRRRNPS